MSHSPKSEVTRLLGEIEQGDSSAFDRLLPLLYEDLRASARRMYRGAGNRHTLQPTALVHEAYARIKEREGAGWESRRHFMAVAAKAMRGLLADYARGRDREKRGGGRDRVELAPDMVRDEGRDWDLVALDGALTRLAEVDPRQAQIVELRFLAGLTVDETAEIVGIAPRTVRLDWQMARAWLRRALAEPEE